MVNVPQPARFAVDKFIVSTRRGKGNPMVRHDVEQAGTLICTLESTRHAYDVKQAWDEAIKRGDKWRAALEQDCSMLSDSRRMAFDIILS